MGYSFLTYFLVKFDPQTFSLDDFCNQLGLDYQKTSDFGTEEALFIGYHYDNKDDLNEMVEESLKDLFGKEEILLNLKKKYNLTYSLERVPTVSNKQHVNLTLNDKIIAFLHNTQSSDDLDYFIEQDIESHSDEEIINLIHMESIRQNEGIELIASENYASKEVRQICSSILTNKYAEGYPGRRYYGGCEYVDKIEQIAIDRVCKLFNVKYANVQPHSGSQANAAAYRALLPEGGKILSLVLNDGGHLTHGSPVSFSSHLYDFVHYPLDSNGKLDYDKILQIAKNEKPDLILAGYSAYPYEIDFKKFKEIADEVNAKFIVDMAHIAGLIAAGVHQNPCDYADVVTSTTHKTLRGPRGGIILTNDETLIKKINSAIFPYYQGGPLEHIIGAKAVCFKEASTKQFKEYAKQVVINTKECQQTLKDLGAITSETENHLFLLNVLDSYGINGKQAQNKLEEIKITTNKNMIPNDTLSAALTSGLRIGFAAVTTRGCNKQDAKEIATLIHNYLSDKISKEEASEKVEELTSNWKIIEEI